ncbi:MAG: DUF805 domain-containing protein [Lactobacillus sp.]|jgi:uncharacterized membrane protein YhaH (DUF805 family)|nr:DUF805 domain-containing protein [Lactobacillus sp.]MCI2033082.1 DUF805 domain-containing protein [Lactobacillus sp.]
MLKSTTEEQALAKNKYYGATGATAIVAWFKNAFNYTGCSSRSEYWWMFLFSDLFGFVIAIVFLLLPILSLVLLLALSVPWISLATRRYRDAGVPGYIATVQMAFSLVLVIVILLGANAGALDWLTGSGSWLAKLNSFSGTMLIIVSVLPTGGPKAWTSKN